MTKKREEPVQLHTILAGEAGSKFKDIQSATGISSKSEVIRYLINYFHTKEKLK